MIEFKVGRLYKYSKEPEYNTIVITNIEPAFDKSLEMQTKKYTYCYIDDPDNVLEALGTEIKTEMQGWEEVKEL